MHRWLLLLAFGSIASSAAATRPELSFYKRFGGSGADSATAVATDAAGNSYVTGTTTSTDFPVKNGFQPLIGGTALRSSTDHGKTWTVPAIPHPVLAVAGSPRAPGVLFAGTTDGIFKSSDHGKTWAALRMPPDLASPLYVEAMIADGQDPNVIYAETLQGVLKSTDAGVSWRMVASWDSGVAELVASPGQPATLFAGLAVPFPPAFGPAG